MKLSQESTDEGSTEQRFGDRRTVSYRTLLGSLLYHRRHKSRREHDHIDTYTDWYGHWPFAATLTIILLCFADAFLTLLLMNNGAVEMNGLMDWLIQKDSSLFVVVKMAITGVALIILVLHFNFHIYKYLAVRYVIYALVPVYSLLIFHELTMLANI